MIMNPDIPMQALLVITIVMARFIFHQPLHPGGIF